jgi:uncharacterized low-complexity protein
MPRSPTAALRAALTMTVLAAALALAAPAGTAVAATKSTAAAHARSAPDACADRLCTRDDADVRSCRTRDGHTAIARCYINRAAVHYRQSGRLARSIAWRESRYHWWVTNSSAHRGLYQFTDTLWAHTPYRARSPYSPRYASLAAMWLWRHGGYGNWACC